MKIKINYWFSNDINYWFSDCENNIYLENSEINYLKKIYRKSKHYRKGNTDHICDIINRLFTENAYINIDYPITIERFLVIESTSIQFEDKKLERIYLDLSEGESSFIVNRLFVTKEGLKVDLCHCLRWEYEEEIFKIQNTTY